MTVFCLEMRSTANWNDVRYRAYTTSQRKADDFKTVAKIKFTDSGHHIIPTVKEHSGKRLPLNNLLADHVKETVKQRAKPKQRAMAAFDELVTALKAIHDFPYTGQAAETQVKLIAGAALNSVRESSADGALSLQRIFSENPLLKEG